MLEEPLAFSVRGTPLRFQVVSRPMGKPSKSSSPDRSGAHELDPGHSLVQLRHDGDRGRGRALVTWRGQVESGTVAGELARPSLA